MNVNIKRILQSFYSSLQPNKNLSLFLFFCSCLSPGFSPFFQNDASCHAKHMFTIVFNTKFSPLICNQYCDERINIFFAKKTLLRCVSYSAALVLFITHNIVFKTNKNLVERRFYTHTFAENLFFMGQFVLRRESAKEKNAATEASEFIEESTMEEKKITRPRFLVFRMFDRFIHIYTLAKSKKN